LGYATITHPFHPLKGQRLKILSTRKVGERDIFSLRTEAADAIAVTRDWTDRADPSLYAGLLDEEPILSVVHLISLAELLSKLGGTKI